MQILSDTSKWKTGAPVLERLRAIILLAGSVRPSSFQRSIGRSVLDLPVDGSRSLFQAWHESFLSLARFVGSTGLPVRTITDGKGPAPALPLAGGEAIL